MSHRYKSYKLHSITLVEKHSYGVAVTGTVCVCVCVCVCGPMSSIEGLCVAPVIRDGGSACLQQHMHIAVPVHCSAWLAAVRW